ncbi:MAG: 16S rRNA (cytosine(967)-C(5))-methyltransferase RsmB [Rhodoferax sp.]|nr:16S rRNA (cytosine(967)-C(5))-methyltransferase RsmB [Rhodoferax sp.]
MMNRKEEPIPLWRQLNATSGVVLAVGEGASGTAAVDHVPTDLRPGVQALAFHVWRNLGRAQALRKQLAPRAPPPAADALLCVALALAWRDAEAPYDMFTLVNQTVEAAKRNPSTKAQASFLNACLRRFLREKDALVAATDADPVAFWNHPAWWIKRLQHERPGQWREILQAANRHAPMTLRVNVRKTSPTAYLASLQQAGIAAIGGLDAAIVLERPVGVQHLPGFEQGLVSVQDAAAQMAAPLLLQGLAAGAEPCILDACAAPGGKTGHLLELTDGQVLALEIDPARTTRIGQNLARLGLQATVVTADAARPQEWWDGQLFDAILLDAPCTASGIVRRHPDVRWLRRESDIAQLAGIQKRMLETLWGLLRPGGRLLYCTCSLFQAEGAGQVQTFLTHNTDAVLLPSPGHLMPRSVAKGEVVPDNESCDHDGFYYALLQKRMA